MAVKDWSTAAASNTSLEGIDLSEWDGASSGMTWPEVNDAFRQMMADLAEPLFRTVYIDDVLYLRSGDDTSMKGIDGTKTEPVESRLERFLQNPANNDDLGIRNWRGKNNADEELTYASLEGRAYDVTDGAEEGGLRLKTRVGGTFANRFNWRAGMFADGLSDGGDGVINGNDVQIQGNPVGFVEVATYTVSGSPSTIDFTGWDGLYESVIIIGRLLMATDDTNLAIRTAGPDDVFDSGATDYAWTHYRQGVELDLGGLDSNDRGDNSDDEIEITGDLNHGTYGAVGVFNGAGGGVEFQITIPTPNLAIRQKMHWHATVGHTDKQGTPALVAISHHDGVSMSPNAEKLGGIRFLPLSGNFSAGEIRVYARLV